MKSGKLVPWLSTLFLALVLATGGLVTVHAMWTETLQVGGTVQTGSLDAGWVGGGCFEFYPWPNLPGDGGFTGEMGGADVASWQLSVDSADRRILRLTVDRGYPSYALDCAVKYRNTGTVPWTVRAIAAQGAQDGNLTNCTWDQGNETLTCNEMTVRFVDGIGSQIQPGGWASSDLMVHVEQGAAELTTYKFEVRVCVSQWNDNITAEQCLASTVP